MQFVPLIIAGVTSAASIGVTVAGMVQAKEADEARQNVSRANEARAKADADREARFAIGELEARRGALGQQFTGTTADLRNMLELQAFENASRLSAIGDIERDTIAAESQATQLGLGGNILGDVGDFGAEFARSPFFEG